MHLDKLAIFSRDTDAYASMLGYEYQKLRTLEIWLESYLQKLDDIIYCDYEEDIFTRNVASWFSQFRQLKLYSSKNFSFKSEEVNKAIFHFFMLFVKGEYKFDDVQFGFETNAGIARNFQDNDASLLEQWNKNQHDLTEELLAQCAAKVRQMITLRLQDTKTKDDEEHINVYDIPESVFEDFAGRIRWQFSDLSPEQAMEALMGRIKTMIAATGFPITEIDPENAFRTLYYTVSQASIAKDPEDRKLESGMIDQCMLQTTNKDERTYLSDWEDWKMITLVPSFRAAEFFQVINAANFARKALFLHHHVDFWQGLLRQYYQMDDVALRFRRQAVKELLWCEVNKQKDEAHAGGSLEGFEREVLFYFKDVSSFREPDDLAEAIDLLTLVMIKITLKQCDLPLKTATEWWGNILGLITSGIANAIDENAACYYHQRAAELMFQTSTGIESNTEAEKLFAHLDAILKLLPKAGTFNAAALDIKINRFIELLLDDRKNQKVITRLENYTDQLEPYVSGRLSAEANAHRYINRGVRYLDSTEPFDMVIALSSFHKAKDLYRHDISRDGYVLALLNIGQIYSAIGCNYAAKFYILSATLNCSNSQNLHRLLADATGMLFHVDFKQGNWVSCLEGFHMYNNAFEQFSLGSRQYDMFDKNLQELALVFSAGQSLSPSFATVLGKTKQEMGDFYTMYLEENVNQLNEGISQERLELILNDELDDMPVNDAGSKRTVTWSGLGITWKVNFANNWAMNAIAEEFCALLQILIVELSLHQKDLHFLESTVHIELDKSRSFSAPKREESIEPKWSVQLPEVLTDAAETIRKQPAIVIAVLQLILEEISLLPAAELESIIKSNFEQEDLVSKTLPDFIYQRAYRHLFSHDSFDDYGRSGIVHIISPYQHTPSKALRWNDQISNKYDQDATFKQIKERYHGFYRNTHLTISHLQSDSGFIQLIIDARNEGWLDWQILMAISNLINSAKMNTWQVGRKYASHNERVTAAHHEVFRLQSLDEKETFVPISFATIKDGLQKQLNLVVPALLPFWHLNYNTTQPDFEALIKFGRKKLRFGEDDLPELSPFRF